MQKFLRGQRVKVAEHGRSSDGAEAIVIGSYSDLCTGLGDDSVNGRYALHILDQYPGHSAWHEERTLTLINADRDEGERIIQQHKADRIAEYHAESDAISASLPPRR